MNLKNHCMIFYPFILMSIFLRISVFAEKSIDISEDIQLIPLAEGVYIHTSWHTLPEFGRFPSNGLILIEKGHALMVDTPMDEEKTRRLVAFLKDSLDVDVTRVIPCHYHADNLGGLAYLHEAGVQSLANQMTIQKCRELGLPVPQESFFDSIKIDFDGCQIEARFPGAGHSFDNIVVWLPEFRILFGGCLVKSLRSKNLGNTEDAIVDEWAASVMRLMKTYPEAEIVIPGHGEHGDSSLLNHTIDLVKAHCKRMNQ